jgi:hypothetical protein
LNSEYEKGALTHSKGRLLFHLVWFGKIKYSPSLSQEVWKSLGYKSRGHLGNDIEDLKNNGYIAEDKKRGYYLPTAKAKEIYEPVLHLKRLAYHNIAAARVVFISAIALFSVQPLIFAFLFLVGTYLVAVAVDAKYSFFRVISKKRYPKG